MEAGWPSHPGPCLERGLLCCLRLHCRGCLCAGMKPSQVFLIPRHPCTPIARASHEAEGQACTEGEVPEHIPLADMVAVGSELAHKSKQ